MRHALAALSIAVIVPAAARSQEIARFSVSLRVGYAIPAGSWYGEPATDEVLALRDGFRSQVPLQIEAAYRVKGRLSAGAYASYGFDSVGRAVQRTCDDVPTTCSADTIRVGVQGAYRLGEIRPRLSPWLGAGVGWEWSAYSRPGLTETFSGPEIASLQAGADWRAGESASVGPYVQLSLGRFSSLEQKAPHGSSSVDIDARFHAWIGVGVRGTIHLR